MKKKKVLVHGTIDSLKEFLQSPFNAGYYPLALISEDFEGIDFNSQNRGGQWEFIAPSRLNKFTYELIDGVVLTDKSALNYFLSEGVEPRKIIIWNNEGVPEAFPLQQDDGEFLFVEGLQFHVRSQEDLNFVNQIGVLLAAQKKFYSLEPSQYKDIIESQYGRKIDWENPKTFTEKIQWLKLYDSTPIKTRLADKYLVRQWVAEKIGAEYLIPLLGVWDNFDDIDFDLLPEQFVLKCNHGSAMNVICRDKKSFDVENAREKINAWLEIDFGAFLYELHYNNIKKKIIAEKFLTDENSEVNDYKFWCFEGKVKYIQVDRNRSTNHVQRFYSTDWEPLSFIISSHTLDDKILEKPAALPEMLRVVEILAEGFNIVRVDFYLVKDKIYFGEMTFTPLSGLVTWTPEDTDYKLGSLFKIGTDR